MISAPTSLPRQQDWSHLDPLPEVPTETANQLCSPALASGAQQEAMLSSDGGDLGGALLKLGPTLLRWWEDTSWELPSLSRAL